MKLFPDTGAAVNAVAKTKVVPESCATIAVCPAAGPSRNRILKPTALDDPVLPFGLMVVVVEPVVTVPYCGVVTACATENGCANP
jgi:hypothetical protein